MAIHQAGNESPSFQIVHGRAERGGQPRQLGADPGNAPAGDEQMPPAARLRGIQLRIGQERQQVAGPILKEGAKLVGFCGRKK